MHESTVRSNAAPALAPNGAVGRVRAACARLLLGRPLASGENAERKIGAVAGVPAVGLDALASSSYGPEAALTVLLPLGAAGLAYFGPVTAVILAVLAMLYLSYRQTIAAYPSGGGAYTVGLTNLGVTPGLLAAAALMLDYVLNVAVAISAGVGALVSAVPALHGYMLPLCLAILGVIALVNLRGTQESGWAFAAPACLFVAAFGAVLVAGAARAAAGRGPVVAPPEIPAAAAPVSVWIVLRAFSSGCTAMTGVEAVSNAMPAFKEPAVKHARRTLTAIVVILALLLVAVVHSVLAFRVGAMPQNEAGYQSVLSQIAGASVGRGALYYVAMGSLLAVLALSANTSFVGFPRLCRVLAADGFLPRAFAIAGRRLVYTVGILFLTATAGGLLIVFDGITDRLIPLFAVGAFLAFTLSQAGMVVHWRRRPAGERGRGHLLVNAAGAAATGAALVVIVVSKFAEGAWITLLAIPVLIRLFKGVRAHYDRTAARLEPRGPLDVAGVSVAPIVVLPIQAWDRLASKAVRFAMRLTPDVVAVHVRALDDPEGDQGESELREVWAQDVQRPAAAAGAAPPRLAVLQTPYRRFVDPIVGYIGCLERDNPGRLIAVVIPELTTRRWWQAFLHLRRGDRLRAAILRLGDPRIVVATVPWVVED